MTITCHIIDELVEASATIVDFVRKTDGLKLGIVSDDPEKVLDGITKDGCSGLVFLNIDMPSLSNLKYLEKFNAYAPVITISSSATSAVQSFERSVWDHLLKPISYERFLIGITKIRNGIVLLNNLKSSDAFFVKSGVKGQFIKVVKSEITYIEAAQNYVQIFLRKGKIITYSSLVDILKKLQADKFSRIHKSFLVNLDSIEAIQNNLVVVNKKALPIGRAYKNEFLNQIEITYSCLYS